MGADKAFLKIGEKTFLENAVAGLSPHCQNIKIVLNTSQTDFIAKLPADVSYIFDIYEKRGALGGIHAALKNCETKYAIILATDLPLITTDAIAKLTNIALASNKFTATVPRQTDGRLQPLCAVYHARYCLPPLEKLLDENEPASARDFLQLIFPRLVDEEKLTNDESKNIFFNVNEPTDFQQIN